MLPTFASITDKQPRLVALFGLFLFVIGVYLWFQTCAKPVTEPTGTDTGTGMEQEEEIPPESAVNASMFLRIEEGCLPGEKELRVKKGDQLTIYNADTVDHILVFSEDVSLFIPKEEILNIETVELFSAEASQLGYSCDETGVIVGKLIVEA